MISDKQLRTELVSGLTKLQQASHGAMILEIRDLKDCITNQNTIPILLQVIRSMLTERRLCLLCDRPVYGHRVCTGCRTMWALILLTFALAGGSALYLAWDWIDTAYLAVRHLL